MKTIYNLMIAGGIAALLVGTGPALSQAAAAAEQNPAAATSAQMTDAEVRKVDKEQGKITLKHGPIANLDMPGMTMVFGVKDKAMLDNVKPGDKVRFRAVDENGKLTVSEMRSAP